MEKGELDAQVTQGSVIQFQYNCEHRSRGLELKKTERPPKTAL
jgi:hypothetical protein